MLKVVLNFLVFAYCSRQNMFSTYTQRDRENRSVLNSTSKYQKNKREKRREKKIENKMSKQNGKFVALHC